MNQQIGAARVVSLLPDGTLRAGAGTTIFPQRGPLPQIPITSTNLLGITFNPPLAAELTPLSKSGQFVGRNFKSHSLTISIKNSRLSRTL